MGRSRHVYQRLAIKSDGGSEEDGGLKSTRGNRSHKRHAFLPGEIRRALAPMTGARMDVLIREIESLYGIEFPPVCDVDPRARTS